jgi:hypothetical protein
MNSDKMTFTKELYTEVVLICFMEFSFLLIAS